MMIEHKDKSSTEKNEKCQKLASQLTDKQKQITAMQKQIKGLNEEISKHKAKYPDLEEQNKKLMKDLEVKD